MPKFFRTSVTSGMAMGAVIVVIRADGEGADGVTVVDQMNEDLHHSCVDMHHLAASTAHGAPRRWPECRSGHRDYRHDNLPCA
jgi:hypothetical protein